MCQNCLTGGFTRRRLIVGAAALAATATLPRHSLAAEAADDAMPTSPEEGLQRLIDGNARYVANATINADYSTGRAARAVGQQPFAAILACADARVAPELIFDQGPGQLFVVRVAGNFINDDGLASLEYGAAVLGIQLIVVLGHTGCGAVGAAIKAVEEDSMPPGHLPGLVDAIRPAVEVAKAANPADLLAAATVANARLNAERAFTAEPILADLARSGGLRVGLPSTTSPPAW
jgi:carbonic anhydrase